ncbi:protease [Rubrivivax gelatinosus]|uniref:S8 family serine peptidase n=1 Tax=Rubrivivax gelatinosus TaxID=28068 RepID=UPI0019042597|nr:S8 family serine peptidase [Rubrivivax gelatinosus]MBK1612962.1 protease [Rubrivivax gelatinosus]
MSAQPYPISSLARRTALAAALLALAACGGGGGGGSDDGGNDDPGSSSGFTVSGTLSVPANLVVDGDTNDINQTRVANDGFASAQAISATSQVMGTVNLPRTGPEGASYAAGDGNDFYRVTLAAGQTLELDFSADPAVHNLDLYVYRQSGGSYALVGDSSGSSSSECLRITSAGEYWVQVLANKGASLYNLRIAAAGAASSCSNTATAVGVQRVLPGQLIAGLAAGTAKATAAGALIAAQPLSLLKGRVAPGHIGLFALDASEKARRRGLLALAGASAEELQAAPRPAWMDELDASSRLQVETLQYAKGLRASGAFDYVVANRPVHASATLVGSYPPNDERYSLQRWHYEQIALPTAMQTLLAMTTQPTLRPIVAVLDTGIVADHPDLKNQIAGGYDFVRDADSAGDGGGIDSNPDDLLSDASQPSFHGTHVAGTIAAETFNGTGVAGVAPMAQLMPLRVLGKGGEGSFYDILQALRYAAGLANDSGTLPARRADVANLSLGAEGTACDADTESLIASVRAQGTMVVAATGNESERDSGSIAAVDFPANCRGVIAVTATNAQRGIAYYANGGTQVALAAPGGDMRVATNGTGLPDGIYSTLATFETGGNRVSTYGQYQGTSMATPHVAGVLALMRWAYPGITPAQVDALLQDGQLSDDYGASGHDSDFGWGLVNAAKAVRAALNLKDGVSAPVDQGVIEAQPSSLDFGTSTTSLNFTLRKTADTDETVQSVSDDSSAVSVAALSVDGAGLGSYRVSVDRSGLATGLYTPTITVTTSRRTLIVTLSIQKLAEGTGSGDIGPVYVLVYDAATDEIVQQGLVSASGGSYRYSLSGITAKSVYIVAGSDYDNDSVVCSRGEACGAYPVLGATLTPVDLSGNRSGLDFLLTPVGVGNAEAASRAASRKRQD